MAKKNLLIACAIIGTCMLSTGAMAQAALFHMQGDVGNREAYYTDFSIVFDRTPMDKVLGPTSVKQLDVIAVYESAQKPEFSFLRIQFECPVKYAYDGKHIPKQLGPKDPVKFKIAPISYNLPRENLKTTKDIPESQWQTGATPVLLKASKFACNNEEINNIVRNTLKKSESTKSFDIEYFRSELPKVGLTKDVILMPQADPTSLLLKTWSNYWLETKHHDPTGAWNRKATKEDIEQYKIAMAKNQAQLAEIKGKYEKEFMPQIKSMQDKFAFADTAAKVRGKRKMSRSEATLIQVWQAKTEDDVVRKFGNPEYNQTANTHFLNYWKSRDNTSTVVNLANGATWEEGLYARCDMQFVTVPDKDGVYKVADVRVTTESNQAGGARQICSDIFDVPNN